MGLKPDRLRESLEEMRREARASLAGSYLLHALGEFRSAGSAEALYRELEPWYTDHAYAVTTAPHRCCRRARPCAARSTRRGAAPAVLPPSHRGDGWEERG